MFIITLGVLLLASNCFADPVSRDDEVFRKYVTDIQSQIDNTVKPCENFGKYACGNLKPEKTYSNSDHRDLVTSLLEKHLTDYKPQNDAEKLILRFYSSCKNGSDIRKIFEQIDVLKSSTWPVTRDYSDEEIAKLFGYLTSLEFLGLMSIDSTTLSKHNKISIKVHGLFEPENITNILEKFNVPAAKSLNTVERIKKFDQQLDTIQTLQDKSHNIRNSTEFKDVEGLKAAVPNFDWDTYFSTFTNVYGFDKDVFVKKTVKIQNLEKLKEMVKLFKETDSKIVADYIIWMYLIRSDKINCEQSVESLFPFLAFKFIQDQTNNPKTFLFNELELFNHFENSLSELKSELNDREAKSINEYVKEEKMIYENYEKFVSGEYLLEMFKEFEMNEKTLYSNMFNIMHAINKIVLTHGEESYFLTISKMLTSAVQKYVQWEREPKPLLNNFITVNTDLWVKTILLDEIYENRTISDKCFPYMGKLENYLNTRYLNYHAAYHIALHDYLNYIDEHKDQFKKQTQILSETGLNNAKLFMLTLAQQRCLTSAGQNEHLNDDNLLWYFKYSKDFSENWGCVAGDAMNIACDDSTFTPNFKKSL